MSVVGLLNTAWMAACRREAMAFRKATRQVAESQARLLAEIVRENQETEFGRAHQFAQIDRPAAYQECVPLSQYEDYAQAIQRIGEGHANVLTRQPVELFEPTSGTTGGEKLIPFTAALRQQFQRAVAAWMYDLLHERPALRRGRAYWSISPAMEQVRRTPSGISIGFDDDAGYLGSAGRWMVRRLLAVPAEVARLRDIEAFRYCTLWYLLGAADLTLISIWNPTFLTMLLQPLEGWHEQLCADLENGRPKLAGAGWRGRGPRARCAERATELRRIFRSKLSWPEKLRLVWPQLSLISCWADAGAASYVGQLRELFPSVELQPKGLLATEGCVSFPLLGREGSVLAVRSHFLEFQEVGGSIRLAHQLDAGGRYRVILTTGGGLYRYQLRDEVEVRGFEQGCPFVRFVGKCDCISDLVGEKLAEPHVRAVVSGILGEHQIVPAFTLVVPVPGQPSRYRLYLQMPDRSMPPVVALAAKLEEGLCENPHYAYARRLGQLAEVEIAVLDSGAVNGWAIYERQCLARGMKAGNIKPLLLDRWTGWPEQLDPLCRTAAEARPA